MFSVFQEPVLFLEKEIISILMKLSDSCVYKNNTLEIPFIRSTFMAPATLKPNQSKCKTNRRNAPLKQ